MSLFERFHLTQDEAEARLKRPLSGNPTRGEIGLLGLLNANRLEDAQAQLARDDTIGADLRDLVGCSSAEGAPSLGDPEGLVGHPAGSGLGRVRTGGPDHRPLGHRVPRRRDPARLRPAEGHRRSLSRPWTRA